MSIENQFTIFEAEAIDQYYRQKRIVKEYEAELGDMPISILKGYISTKKIYGREYCYLQWKENGKLKSQYLKKTEVQETLDKIELRKNRQRSINRLKESIKSIEKFIGKERLTKYENG